jgi:predicted Fe-Mo cluster-binding NifX family protein
MKIAITVWGEHISTVFDFSGSLMIADIESGYVKDKKTVDFSGDSVMDRIMMLKKSDVDVLLCGAISRQSERLISALGIEIVPFLSGAADEVLEAYLSGHLMNECFLLPGCRRAGWCRGERGMKRRGGRCNRNDMKKGWRK